MVSGSNNTVSSVQRAFKILETIRNQGDISVTELAQQLDVSKSTVHNHLKTMEESGYIVKTDGSYRLGLRFLSFPDVLQKSNRLYQAAKDEVEELVDRTNERGQVLCEENGSGVYIYQQKTNRSITTDTKVGSKVSLHSSAIGKALLAFQPQDKVDEIIDRDGLPAHTKHTITSRDELEQELERVREEGTAFDDEEGIEGLRCVAAPIRDSEGISVGAISISGPCTRISGDQFREALPQEVKRAAQAIEINYQFS